MHYRIILIVFIFLVACQREPKIDKIEHIYLSSKNALAVFNDFKNEFDLPVVWEFADWGNFKSGGLSLGNVVLEITERNPQFNNKPFGVALLPNTSIEKIISKFEDQNLLFKAIKESKAWSTMRLDKVLPDSIDLILCDYYDRSLLRKERKTSRHRLTNNTWGIHSVKEIILHVENATTYVDQFSKLQGVIQKGTTFSFSEGPALKLIEADQFVVSLFLEVHFLDVVKTQLQNKGIEIKRYDQGVLWVDYTPNVKLCFTE